MENKYNALLIKYEKCLTNWIPDLNAHRFLAIPRVYGEAVFCCDYVK